MNIDLRNVSLRMSTAVNAIKHIRKVKTNTEAVQIAVVEYVSMRNENKHWKHRALSAESDLAEIKNAISFLSKLQ